MKVVPSIAELMSMQPQEGECVQVLGYHQPNDGGGGVFYSSDDGEATNGATVFAYIGDTGLEQSDNISISELNNYAFGENVAWGSVNIDLHTSIPVSLTDVHLHGHATDSNSINELAVGQGRLDYKSGIFLDRNDTIPNKVTLAGGASLTIQRKLLNSDKRWIRHTSGDAIFHYKWIGPTGTETDGHLLSWALNIACGHGYNVCDLDQCVVSQSGIIEVPMNMTLRNGTIKLRGDDWAMLLHRISPLYDFSNPEYFVDQMQPWISGANSEDSSGVTVELDHLELDGNILGNKDILLNQDNYQNLQNTLTNSTHWSGWSWFDQNQRKMPPNSFCNINRCHFHDFGSNCMVGYFTTLYQTNQLKLGNSAGNHLWYSVNGSHDSMYMYGFANGTYSKSEGCKVTNLTCEELTTNPYLPSANQIWYCDGDDWGDGSKREPSRFDWRPGSYFQNVTIKVGDGLFMNPVFGMSGQCVKFGNVTVITNTDQDLVVLGDFSNNYTGMNRSISIEDVTIIVRNGPDNKVALSKDHLCDCVSIDRACMFVRRGFAPPSKELAPIGEYMVLSIPDRNTRTDPGFAATRTAKLKNFSYTAEYGVGPVRLADIEASDTTPIKFLVENGFVRTQYSNMVLTGNFGAAPSGNTDLWTINDPTKFEGSWHNVHFDVFRFSGINSRAFLLTAKEFKNVSIQYDADVTQILFDREVISFTSELTGNESSINIPTNLFWVPKSVSNVTIVGKDAYTSAILKDLVLVDFLDRQTLETIEWDGINAGEVDYRAPIIRANFANALQAGCALMEIHVGILKP